MSEQDINAILAKYDLDPSSIHLASDVITTKKWDCTHRDVMNVPIIVLSAEDIKTSYGDGKLALCIVEGAEKNVLMGGSVLVQQLNEAAESLPMRATVKKQGRYYTFT